MNIRQATKHILTGTAFITGVVICMGELPDWKQEDCQYRLTCEVSVPKPGWYEVILPENLPQQEASRLSGFPFRPESFSFNRVHICAITPQGEKALPESGYYLLPAGEELIPGDLPFPAEAGKGEGAQEKDGKLQYLVDSPRGKQIAIPVEAGKMYLCKFKNSGGGSPPTVIYEPIFEKGSRIRKYNYNVSYLPRLLRQGLAEYEILLQPDKNDKMLFYYTGSFMGKIHSLSLKETRITLLIHFDKPGTQRFRLYFQPVNSGIYLSVPEKRMTAGVPAGKITGTLISSEKQKSDNNGLLFQSDWADVFTTPATAKITPSLSLPNHKIPCVKLSTARNEKESFQLVIAPKRNFKITGIDAELKSGTHQIPRSAVEVKTVKYVPVRYAVRVSPWRYQGLIGDPLAKFENEEAKPDKGNLALWFTISIGKDVPAGLYKGNITLKTDRAGTITVPVDLKVRSFTLPDMSSFITNMGLQLFTKGSYPVALYHGAKTPAEVKKLTDLYFEKFAENRLSPKNFTMYTPLTFKWAPPPKGMNVAGKDNYFRLYDWDFTEYNKQLDHFIGKLKMNQICIYHTNPISCNVFPQLPGKELEKGFNTSSPFVTMANQAFREMTMVGYDMTPKHAYSKITQKITREQFDRLLTDYLRAIAGNLEKKGYLKYATILIDESHNEKQLTHFLSLLKNDPLLKKIKVTVCVQGTSYYTLKDQSGKYVYRKLIDTYVPEIDETYDRWETFYQTDYAIPEERSAFMPYIAYSSRITVDAPGMTNRIVGFDVFRRGGSGLLDWETVVWNTKHKGGTTSPWIDSFGYYNGGTAYFYPPLKGGYPDQPDYTLTPSLRLELLRDAADDFDYAFLLEETIKKAKKQNIDCSKAEAVLHEIDALFDNSVIWSINDQQLSRIRKRIADEIESFDRQLKK